MLTKVVDAKLEIGFILGVLLGLSVYHGAA